MLPVMAILDLVLLLGRPASGKSEIIDYITRRDPADRLARLHMGAPVVLDDFPMLWAWFEEDAILERMGRARLHSDSRGYFQGRHLWEVLIRRLSLEYDKLCAGDRALAGSTTVIVEFSRGTEHGGYAEALPALSDAILDRAAVLYVEVSFQESLRKNRRRFNPDKPHSILEHGLPDEKMERLYRDDDWRDVPRADPDHLLVRGRRIPAVVFANEDDVTTGRGEALGGRLASCLDRLQALRHPEPAGGR